MSCHGEAPVGSFLRPTLGQFLEMHGVSEVKILNWLPLHAGFVAEARYGMYLAQSERFSGSPEDAIKQAVLRVRVLAGHPEELAERPEEFYGPKSGLPKKPECLVCRRREEVERSRVGAAVG